MTSLILLTPQILQTLDLRPIEPYLRATSIGQIAADLQIQFQIDYPRAEDDPRELSEIPEVRLWFIRLDSQYPWLPLYLNWEAGELARYTAMLVPHQFSPIDGIRYNPEALEIFVMQKIFVISSWLARQQISSQAKLKLMIQALGYELDDGLFELLK